MKKLFLGVATVMAMMFTVQTNAQESFLSAGIELGLPMGDWAKDVYGFTAGVSVEYELGLSDNLGVNLGAGYQILTVDDVLSDFIKSSALIPIQLGANYYLDESRSGLFIGAKVGLHMFSVATEDIDMGPLGTIDGESNTESYLSLAPQVGYFVTENLSLALRYQMFFISEDEDTGAESDMGSYLGLRAAWNF